jgi:hypothetical protein
LQHGSTEVGSSTTADGIHRSRAHRLPRRNPLCRLPRRSPRRNPFCSAQSNRPIVVSSFDSTFPTLPLPLVDTSWQRRSQGVPVARGSNLCCVKTNFSPSRAVLLLEPLIFLEITPRAD